MPTFTTACPRNCYSTCSMRVQVENGRIRRIESHPDNRATPEGVCLKGLSYYERVHSPDRILHPLRRSRRSGSFERISWDDAYDWILRELEVTKRTGGSQAMFYYAGSGTKGLLNAVGMQFWRLWGGCTATYGDLCWPAGLEATRLTLGENKHSAWGGCTATYGDLCWPAGLEATRLTLGENKHSAPWDLSNARLIVLWGKNAAETNIHQMVFVQEALDAGARLVVIDPRRTETAERADLFLQPRPGTDGALALGVAHLLVDSGRVDREFIDRHVSGYAEFAERIREYTPEWAAAVTEVPEGRIRRLADLLGEIRPATISAGYGMQFWRLWGGCTATYGDLCWPAGLEATRLTLGENKHSATVWFGCRSPRPDSGGTCWRRRTHCYAWPGSSEATR
jgi:anaerobic selenocysteine-containing dehydrogenase